LALAKDEIHLNEKSINYMEKKGEITRNTEVAVHMQSNVLETTPILRYLLPILSFQKYPREGINVRKGEKDKRNKSRQKGIKIGRRKRKVKRWKREQESKVTLNASRYHVREHLGGSSFVTRYAFLFAS
jgi:hypothetical protein